MPTVRSSQLCGGCRSRVEMARGNSSLQASLCEDCAGLSPGETAEVVFDEPSVATDGGRAVSAAAGGHVVLDQTGERARIQLSAPAAAAAGAGVLGAGLTLGWYLA